MANKMKGKRDTYSHPPQSTRILAVNFCFHVVSSVGWVHQYCCENKTEKFKKDKSSSCVCIECQVECHPTAKLSITMIESYLIFVWQQLRNKCKIYRFSLTDFNFRFWNSYETRSLCCMLSVSVWTTVYIRIFPFSNWLWTQHMKSHPTNKICINIDTMTKCNVGLA